MNIAPITLHGSRIRLEPLLRAHHSELCNVGLEPRLWARTTIRVRTSDEMMKYIDSVLDAQRARTAIPFVIVLRESGRIVGSTRFHSITPMHRRCEIGFTWVGVPWQRTGINLESKYLLLTHAFEEWACERVEFKADTDNDLSRLALRELGAVEEGVLRSYMVSEHAGVRDLALFSIVASEWPAVRSRLQVRFETSHTHRRTAV